MFLFDIFDCMFVRKQPELTAQYRDQLRRARDNESMMSIERHFITQVKEIAVTERADRLSERIAMMLHSEY